MSDGIRCDGCGTYDDRPREWGGYVVSTDGTGVCGSVVSDCSPKRLGFADPVYLGCSKLYPEHPDSGVWDDPQSHADLLADLDARFDGFAYCMSSVSLQTILPLAPSGIRVAAWVKPFAAYKANVRIAYTWEPVLFKPGRDSSKDGAPLGRDHLSQGITLKKGLTGAKPPEFCRWVLDLMGYVEGDTVDDLFPGTGVMGRVLDHGTLAL